MTRILQVGDSFLGVDPYRSPVRAEEVWRGFERSIDAAIAHEVDVWLHTGMLISEFCQLRDVEQRLRQNLERLLHAAIVPVLHQTRHDLLGLDVDCVLPGEAPVEARGLSFSNDATRRGGPSAVLLQHGRVAGCGGMDPALPLIDPWSLLNVDVAWVALAGSGCMQPVQPNAWYAGQTARVDARDTHAVGGLLVELDPTGGAQPSVSHVTWPDRPHHVVRFEALGLAAPQLARVLTRRVCSIVEQDADPGRSSGRAVLSVRVQNAAVAFEQTLHLEPRLRSALSGCCVADIDWNGERHLLIG